MTINNLIEQIDNYNDTVRIMENLGAIMWVQPKIQFTIPSILNYATEFDITPLLAYYNDDDYPYKLILQLDSCTSIYSLVSKRDYEKYKLAKYK